MTIPNDESLRYKVLHDQDFDLVDEGGSTAGAARVIAFDFAHDTAGLNNGVTVFTPAVGDVLLDAWVTVTEAFDGTTPQAEIGTFVGGNGGLIANGSPSAQGIFLDIANDEGAGAGVLSIGGNTTSMSSLYIEQGIQDASGVWWPWQAVFTATNPLKLVVSQNAQKGGTAIGGTTGEATLYLMVATPTSV